MLTTYPIIVLLKIFCIWNFCRAQFKKCNFKNIQEHSNYLNIGLNSLLLVLCCEKSRESNELKKYCTFRFRFQFITTFIRFRFPGFGFPKNKEPIPIRFAEYTCAKAPSEIQTHTHILPPPLSPSSRLYRMRSPVCVYFKTKHKRRCRFRSWKMDSENGKVLGNKSVRRTASPQHISHLPFAFDVCWLVWCRSKVRNCFAQKISGRHT